MSKGIEESKLEHIREIFIDGYKENISLKDIEEYKSKNFINSDDIDFVPDILDYFISLNNKNIFQE